MIYLSAKGEVLGQFEEKDVPQMLRDGKISPADHYWREGMTEWRSVTELPPAPASVAETKPVLPKLVPASVVAAPASSASASEAVRSTEQQQDKAKPRKTVLPEKSFATGRITTTKLVKPTLGSLAEGAGTAAVSAKPAMPAASPLATADANVSAQPKPEVKGALPKLVPSASPAAAPKPQAEATESSTKEKEPLKKTLLPRRAGDLTSSAVAKLVKPSPESLAEGAEAAPIGGKLVIPDSAQGTFKNFKPRTGASPMPASAAPERAGNQALPTPKGGRGKGLLVWLSLAVLLAAAAGGGTWWWLNRAPAAIPGSVALNGDESGPVEIRVFRRAELAGPWRERLAAADVRAAELEKLLATAQEQHREKSLLYDEASRVCEVGEEYNMPDVEELRADRDAKKAEAEAAKAELDKLQAEKDGLLSFEAILQAAPPPLSMLVADIAGNFVLPTPEEAEVVLLATATSEVDGRREMRGWLEVVESTPEGEWPAGVQFAEANRLDLEEIRRFSSASESQ